MSIELSEQLQAQSQILARNIVDACEQLPFFGGLAALIAATGSMCFNEAEGDVDKAMIRARTVAAGIEDVIRKLHQSEQGNGPLEDV